MVLRSVDAVENSAENSERCPSFIRIARSLLTWFIGGIFSASRYGPSEFNCIKKMKINKILTARLFFFENEKGDKLIGEQ
jgi:hypothetical protein